MSIPLEQIRGVGAFAGMDDRALGALAAALQARSFPDGTMLLEQGTRRGGLYVVLQGRVRVVRNLPDGSTVDLTALDRGRVFGILSVLDGGPRAASCITKGPTEVAEMSRVDFLGLMEGQSPLALRFQVGVLRGLYRDLRATNGRLAELAALPPQAVDLQDLGHALDGIA